MRCPFCAEEIQDAAVLCRYCGATKYAGNWTPSDNAAPPFATKRAPPGRNSTLRLAGAFLVASAIFEVFSITGEVPLFGAVRGGVVAIGYHALFAAVFGAMGVGLWRAAPWGYRAVLWGTGIYAVSSVIYLLDDAGRSAALTAQTSGYAQIFEFVDRQSIDRLVTSMTLVFLACWIGFAVYVHLRRDYFESAPTRIAV